MTWRLFICLHVCHLTDCHNSKFLLLNLPFLPFSIVGSLCSFWDPHFFSLNQLTTMQVIRSTMVNHYLRTTGLMFLSMENRIFLASQNSLQLRLFVLANSIASIRNSIETVSIASQNTNWDIMLLLTISQEGITTKLPVAYNKEITKLRHKNENERFLDTLTASESKKNKILSRDIG